MLQISKELKDCMSDLRCERLTFRKENKTLIQSFNNDQNKQLPKILKSIGWKEDSSCCCDYYLVKDRDDNILFFFALKAGLVQVLYNKERIEACKTVYPLLVEYFDINTSKQRKDELYKRIIPVWKKYELTTELIVSAQNDIEQEKQKDRTTDTNGNTTQVWQTHSAIELAFFCQNTDCKDIIQKLGFKRHFGSAVFWYYIMPIVLKIQKYIGCEYVYLFAADRINRGKLMDHYNTSLHFEQTIYLSGIKPMQDNNCFFMCQKVETLQQYQKDYIKNFSFSNNPNISM